jgi:putative ABC transport system permease protein
LIALLIAAPIAWWLLNKWLDNFVYRIHFEWWYFAYTGAAAILVALLTVSYQSIKAATANPVDRLRDE